MVIINYGAKYHEIFIIVHIRRSIDCDTKGSSIAQFQLYVSNEH